MSSRAGFSGPSRVRRLTGGGTRSPLWTQLFADVLGTPVSVGDAPEASVLGAALCAAVGGGLHPSVAEAADRAVRVARTFEPDPPTARRLAAAYERWLALADALGPSWRRAGGR